MKNAFLFLLYLTFIQILFSQDLTPAQKKMKSLDMRIPTMYGLNPKATIAVASPEIIRYDSLSDVIEVASNKMLYQNFGSDYGSFSVGLFQMKPKFLESLKEDIKTYELTQLDWLFESKKDEERARILQVATNPTLATHALCAFWLVCESKGLFTDCTNDEERLSRAASAYNYGYRSDIEKIKKWEKSKAFSLKRFTTAKYGFCEIALRFFRE